MGSEQGDVVVNEGLSQEEIAAQKAEQEAFAAEMASETVEIDAPAPISSTEAKTEPVVNQPTEPVVERKEVIKGFTEEEIRAAMEMIPKLQKTIDTTNGTFGSRLAEQQQLITQLQAQRQAVGSLSPEKLTRLSKEYPELAEIIASDLSEFIGQNGGQQQVIALDPEQQARITNEIVAQRLLEKERNDELKALGKKHADWKETASFTLDESNNSINWKNPKFGEWVKQQPAEVANRITGVWDADFVAEQLDKFKEAIKPKAVPKEIQDAVLPKGTRRQATSTSDLSEEEAAYRAEMARR